jgi:uncharacterized protein (UPF0248 family)
VQTLQQLFARIRWDPRFSAGAFTVGYYDRVLDRELVIPFSSIAIEPATRRTFTFVDEDGVERTIPLHRVRAVYRDGAVIWRRPSPPRND